MKCNGDKCKSRSLFHKMEGKQAAAVFNSVSINLDDSFG